MGEKKDLVREKLELTLGRTLIDRLEEGESELRLGADEALTIFLLPSQKYKNKKLTVWLEGRGSRVEILGALLGGGEEESKISIRVIHKGRETSAYIHLRTVLFGQSRSLFSGLIRIEKDAIGSGSLLEDRVLVLGEAARAESVPSLEIEANEVKASHAATVGRIDEEQLFYLESRGVSRATAVRMIVEGFFEPVLRRLSRKDLVAQIRGELWADALKQYLPDS
ncbi:MAG: SufD family Fe-S cluster assembly protein [Patescibacteria group bacterium]|nr:SufD family Fe-S cluster assembly protein [Patescibacteria group bacterium]